MNFYMHYIGDYGRDTGDLSMLEHGAYRLMLDQFYGSGRPLPANKQALYRILRAESKEDRKAVDAVSIRFWRPVPEDLETLYDMLKADNEEEQNAVRTIAQDWEQAGGLINVRAMGEIVKATIRSQKIRVQAIEREAAKRAKRAQESAQGGAK